MDQNSRLLDNPLAATVNAFVEASQQEDRESQETESGRDEAAMRLLTATRYGGRECIRGGGLCRATRCPEGPNTYSLGYLRYVHHGVDPAAYEYRILPGGWRIALLRSTSEAEKASVLNAIMRGGPASGGYARIGDTLVPASLGPGDRQTLAHVEILHPRL